MSFSLVLSNGPSGPNLPSPGSSSRFNRVNVPWRFVGVCYASQLGLGRLLIAKAEEKTKPSVVPIDTDQENKDGDKMAKSKDTNAKGIPNFSVPAIPPWAKWFLGSLFLLVLPFYKKFLNIEDKIQKTTTTVLDVIEKVAEVVDEVAEDVEKSLPENSKLKKIADEIEEVAEEINKDANKLETIVNKVDEIVDKVDAIVEPIIEGNIAVDRSKSNEM
ncbi:hypothetical protein LUZ63_018601 [Rhynchospora breviuscula]|uniref:Uncharacterized protein n=1 Tax=Rhynchospora breviuscula TaxID=2022672 RepID=A0A9Q0C4N4_9POAL|nr:hypothetical protein LUZ63_018601 [Rhynchospora breviuscula]